MTNPRIIIISRDTGHEGASKRYRLRRSIRASPGITIRKGLREQVHFFLHHDGPPKLRITDRPGIKRSIEGQAFIFPSFSGKMDMRPGGICFRRVISASSICAPSISSREPSAAVTTIIASILSGDFTEEGFQGPSAITGQRPSCRDFLQLHGPCPSGIPNSLHQR